VRESDSNLPNDSLDDLLAQATWPNDPQSIHRLESQWREIRRPRYWRIAVPVALAACVVIGFVLMRAPRREPAPMPIAKSMPAPIAAPTAVPLVRPPTELERLRLAAVGMLPPAPKQLPADPVVEELIIRLSSPQIDDRIDAARKLAHLDDSHVTEKLQELVQRDQSVREALAVLQARKDPAAKTFVTSAMNDPNLSLLLYAVRYQYPNL